MDCEVDIMMGIPCGFVSAEERACSFGEGRIKTVVGESRSLGYYR